MDTIRTLLRLLPAAAAFFAIAWFVTFQFNPYKWCDDHPNPEMKDKYYLCEPFGFDLKKGLIDRSIDDRFAGEDKVMYFKKNGTQEKKKEYNCNDDNVLMTKDGYNYCMGLNK